MKGYLVYFLIGALIHVNYFHMPAGGNEVETTLFVLDILLWPFALLRFAIIPNFGDILAALPKPLGHLVASIVGIGFICMLLSRMGEGLAARGRRRARGEWW